MFWYLVKKVISKRFLSRCSSFWRFHPHFNFCAVWRFDLLWESFKKLEAFWHEFSKQTFCLHLFLVWWWKSIPSRFSVFWMFLTVVYFLCCLAVLLVFLQNYSNLKRFGEKLSWSFATKHFLFVTICKKHFWAVVRSF